MSVLGRICAFAALGATLVAVQPVDASIIYGTAGVTISQNFDSLASSGGPHTWTDNATLVGWYSSRGTYDASTGSSATGGLFSYGVAGANLVGERALGSLASGSTGTITYGIAFQNTVGFTLTSFDVSYVGEQWRRLALGMAPPPTTDQRIQFRYGFSSMVLGSLASAVTAVTALDFDPPTYGAPTGSIDGNLAANRQAKSQTIVDNWLAGDYLWLTWTDIDSSGDDIGLGIDDFSFTAFGAPPPPPAAVPEPSSLLALGLGVPAFAAWRSRRRKQQAKND